LYPASPSIHPSSRSYYGLNSTSDANNARVAIAPAIIAIVKNDDGRTSKKNTSTNSNDDDGVPDNRRLGTVRRVPCTANRTRGVRTVIAATPAIVDFDERCRRCSTGRTVSSAHAFGGGVDGDGDDWLGHFRWKAAATATGRFLVSKSILAAAAAKKKRRRCDACGGVFSLH